MPQPDVSLDQQLSFTGSYIIVSATDFVQTFPAEVRAIWSRSLKGPSTLFILNRYSFLGYLILRLIVGEAKTPTASGCLLHDKLLNAFGTVSVVSAGLLLSLRVYALYGQSKTVLGSAIALILSRMFIDVDVAVKPEHSTPGGLDALCPCEFIPSNIKLYTRFEAIIPLLGLAFDTFIFVLTQKKTQDHAAEMRRLGHSSVTQLIWRDGVLYFLIPNILTNRMVISLRVYDSDGPPADTTTPDSSSGVDFTWNPWLGNIGFSLDADEQDDERGGDYFK
ncbi:uncharacterized protein STEHIDRAFT_114986 [Stereum hirsutum FP-91666 SS1]|uniref:uncharacterized protein n=1 Tax=Stereum hirsutum (strain FP-91666) TaxID=721885 RepID=UPI0004449EB7|nr:uncharacterized protein STEHIDRAFT_114986 [Stereum hirsutum FP-91666 SS1]EIM81570.1 hypothetical protein STEHIDRAFT_114986 [Stereum hirsutum FP-91666 SS1]